MSLMLFVERKCPRGPDLVASGLQHEATHRSTARSRFRLAPHPLLWIFSRAFRREQQAVAAGLALYHSTVDPNSTRTLLRRNIHRIEKGLLMRPRRERFALSYIGETVDCYRECRMAGCAADWAKDLAWAHDILESYFEVVADEGLVERAQAVFLSVDHPAEEGRGGRVPYSRRGSCPVSFDSFAALAKRRRSVRWFLQTEVPHVLIDRALEIAAESPTACNRQPFSIVFR